MTSIIFYVIFGLICVATWIYLYQQIMESDYSKGIKFLLLFLSTAFIVALAVLAVAIGLLIAAAAGGSKKA